MMVPVMKVRDVMMAMPHRLVFVSMGMRLSGGIAGKVLMLVMLIVAMEMLMFQGFMSMVVLMVLGQMQPYSHHH